MIGIKYSGYLTDDELKGLLQSHLEQMLNSVFRALQKANSDAMGFGRFAAMRFLTAEDWEAYDWKAAYRALSVGFSVHIRLAHCPRGTVSE